MRIVFWFPFVLLTSCTTIIQPAIQTEKTQSAVNETQITPKKGRTVHYQCDQGTIKVTTLSNLAQRKTPSITITFQHISQHLLPIIAASGKRYANTQWNWWVQGKSAVLSDSLGRTLADNCQRQK
ncbi:MliC family protein [Spirabiliibacterium falconis]|uniref:MliC family protein n=1 Tax=Spirabiliibacterium falconis TaxID=572023 RepID=UPI001AAD0905|nr:MliC family protein [Spirabiliibacterium falconis]MBE2893631.1 hypothetical protein [Spirabiliibacterium falconis]